MTVPTSKHNNGDDETGGIDEEADNRKENNEGTPLLSLSNKSESVVSNRSVRFDEESTRPAAPSESSQRSNFGRLPTFKTASSYLDHFTRSERERALKQPGVGEAAFLIRDAILGEQENPSAGTYNPYANPDLQMRNTISILCRRVCASRQFRKFIYLVVCSMVLLSFVEPPAWCYDVPGMETSEEDAMSIGDCRALLSLRGPPAGGDPDSKDDVEYYPNSVFFLISRNHAAIYEWACTVLLGIFYLLLIGRDGCSFSRFFRKGPAQLHRLLGTASVICLLISLIVSEIRGGSHTRVAAPFFRIVLLSVFSTGTRREIRTILKLMPEVMTIVFLLFIVIAFYAWLGVVTFYGSEEGKLHFPNFMDGMWTLWICVTTANYPDVMMPAYNENRLTAVYFVIFMIITFFFLMNVILASVVNAYENELDRRRSDRKQTTKKDLEEAFQLMQRDGQIDRETVMALFLILNEDFPEFRTIPEDDAKLLFALLDKDGSNQISKDEFMNFGKVMLVEFDRADTYETFVEKHFPTLFNSTTYQSFSKFVKSNWFERVIDVLLVLNAIVIAIQSYPELAGEYVEYDPKTYNGKIDTGWEYVETLFTVIYVLEFLSKVMVLGWKRYSESPKNLFDMTITFLALFSTAYVYYPNGYSNSRLIRYVVMARVLRLTRLLYAMKPFRLIAGIALEIVPLSRMVLLALFCLLYTFACLGMLLYGGMITRDPNNPLAYLVLDTDFSDNDYWANNFNDMISGLNVLFNLLVVNNWTQEYEGYAAVTQSRLCRYFFIAFHIFGVILVNNVVTAFIVNSFIEQWDRQNPTDDEHEVEGEAVIHGREAVFDASRVTGTATFLSGLYVAKLKRRAAAHQSVRGTEVLRSLFTKKDSISETTGAS